MAAPYLVDSRTLLHRYRAGRRSPRRSADNQWALGLVLTIVATGALLIARIPGVPGLVSAAQLPARPPVPIDPAAPWRALHYNRDGTPVRWNPCEPIHWAINGMNAADNAIESVGREAFDLLASASGLTFVFDGYTGDDSGARRHRILVAFVADPREGDPEAAGWEYALPQANRDGYGVYDEADVRVRTAYQTSIHVWLHELMHVLGAAHAPGPGQVMSVESRWATVPQAGDRAALRALGAPAGCLRSST